MQSLTRWSFNEAATAQTERACCVEMAVEVKPVNVSPEVLITLTMSYNKEPNVLHSSEQNPAEICFIY